MLVLSVAATAVHAEDVLGRIREKKTITIAYRDAAFPFSFLDQDKKPVGYSIDLCLKLADAIKQQLKLPQLAIAYVPATSDNRMDLIQNGKADLECGATTNTAERRKSVAFTIPHFVAGERMLVKTDSNIKNWPDLRNKKVAVTKGTTNLKPLEGRGQVRALNLKVVDGRDHNDSFHILETGGADAFATDDVLLYGLKATAKNPSAYAVVGDPLTTEPYAIMLSKTDPAFKKFVDGEMSRIIHDYEINKLYDKWFLKPIPAKDNFTLNMPMSYLFRDSLRFPTDQVGN
ncbi:amino acid ABC transporter substrate-binding protein [Paraherbaspirillum soli]|uniref:Amino acid ABC transporter substrate-binding protein n=1 Tax=Paraherbaspirillum soli TaxID=631222 RepID=A0ABW0MI49_9BURK